MSNSSIMNNDQYSSYLTGLNASVEQYKMMNPEKYETAQAIGNDMMSLSYDLESGTDMKGSCLRCKNVLMSIYQYGLEKDDMYDEEYDLLKTILVFHLKCLNDVDDIFLEEKEKLNKCLQIINEKIKELSFNN